MALNIEEYFKGTGVNLSTNQNLNGKKINIQANNHLNGKKINLPVNNLYFLKDYLDPESQDFLYMENISETKFYRILLKEMSIYCKVNGYLIIQYGNKEILSFKKLVEEICLCSKAISEIIVDSDKRVIIVKKIKKYLNSSDSIDKWSFGIITNGKRKDWVERQIQSIKEQKIPFYEIIVCGTYFDRNEPNFKYIPFNEKDDMGWITKKKNLICESAKYENLCVLHDRIVLDKNWFKGMKKYGNYFEVLGCVIKDKDSNRAGDWITFGNWFGKFPQVGLLEYKDWDKTGCLDGGLCIMKKSVWRSAKWNEKLFWNQAEDAELSHRWYSQGILTRFNPYSSCLTLRWRHGVLSIYEFDSLKLRKLSYRENKLINMVKFYVKKLLGNKAQKYIRALRGI